MTIASIPTLAANAYKAYAKATGGKTFDGKPLPTYEQLGADRHAGWEAAVRQVVAQANVPHYDADHYSGG